MHPLQGAGADIRSARVHSPANSGHPRYAEHWKLRGRLRIFSHGPGRPEYSIQAEIRVLYSLLHACSCVGSACEELGTGSMLDKVLGNREIGSDT